MNSFYRDILKDAWRVVWHHKGLWLFGIFAALISEEIEAIYRNYLVYSDRTFSWENIQSFFSTENSTGIIGTYRDLLVSSPVTSIISLIIIVALVAFAIWLIIVSITAVVYQTNTIAKNKPYRWGQGFGAGVAFFWPVLALHGILKAVDYILIFLIGLVTAWLFMGSGSAVGVILVIIMFAVSLILSFIMKYAIGFIVIKDQPVFTAMKSAWALLRKNWIVSVEMAILLFLISVIIGLALVLVSVLIAVPFLLLIFLLNAAEFSTALIFLFTVATVIIIIITITIGGALGVYRYSSWTLLFLRLVEGKGKSKIVRAVEYFQKRSAKT